MPPPASPLSELLRRADPADCSSPTEPAAFAAAVHARIRSANTVSAWHGRPARGFVSALGRHLFPLAACLALVAGGSVAYAQHQRKASEFYATAYAKSVDPFLMHAEHSAR